MAKQKEADQRDILAKSLGAIKCIEVDGKRLYLKMPTRNIIGISFARKEHNQVEAYEIIAKGSAIRECSDMEVVEKDELFLSILSEIAEFLGMIQLKKSTSRTL